MDEKLRNSNLYSSGGYFAVAHLSVYPSQQRDTCAAVFRAVSAARVLSFLLGCAIYLSGPFAASQSVSGQQVVSKSAVSWQQVIETYSLDPALTWDKIEPFLQQVKLPRLLKEILNALGYNDPYYFKKTFINPLIQAGIISMTIPDKPTSSNQKYVLTDKGVKLLSENVR